MILTIIINLALLPLRMTAMKTSLKMQKLQPKMEEIKKRYEKYPMRDPRRAEMNQEIWDLQKKEGANPISGCLPLLFATTILVCLLFHAGERDRVATRALVVDP